MSAPDLNPCLCGARLAPRLTESLSGFGSFSLGVWVMCPTCDMAGPRTFACLESDIDCEREILEAQAEAARTWNRIMAACSTLDHLTNDGSDRFPSLRGRTN